MARVPSSAEAAVIEAVILDDIGKAAELLRDFHPGELRDFIHACEFASALARDALAVTHPDVVREEG